MNLTDNLNSFFLIYHNKKILKRRCVSVKPDLINQHKQTYLLNNREVRKLSHRLEMSKPVPWTMDAEDTVLPSHDNTILREGFVLKPV